MSATLQLIVRPLISPFRVRRRSEPTTMTCEEFAESALFDQWLSTYIDESYWSDSFSTSYAFDKLIDAAGVRGIWLKDVETWDYDRYFDNAYHCAEKGLS